jgi:hypothetical protein
MPVEHIEFLVEEISMEAALESLLPKMLTRASFKVHSHQGKPDLLRELPRRLRGYASWIPATWRIVIIVDRDDDDCTELKQALEAIARQAGLRTRSGARGATDYVIVNRLAIEELEAWYFGDWQAVVAAYRRTSPTIPAKAGFVRRMPSKAARTRRCCACFSKPGTSPAACARSRRLARSPSTWCHRGTPPRASVPCATRYETSRSDVGMRPR